VAAAAILLEQGQSALQRRQIDIECINRFRIDREEWGVHLHPYVRRDSSRISERGLGSLEPIVAQ
jgi:hypothetical protein